jgi:hypothetical protein
MEPKVKSYMVVARTDAVAKRLGRQCAYEEGFIRTRITNVTKLPPSPHTPMLNLPGGKRAWRVDILMREQRTSVGATKTYMDLWKFPVGTLIETTAPSIFVSRGTTTPIPIGTRGKVLGTRFDLLRVRLDGAAHATLLSPYDIKAR